MSPDAPSRTAWFLCLALWGAGLGAAAQYGKVSVVFGPLAAQYPEAGARLGFVVSSVGLVGIALGVVAGLVVSRLGYRRTLLAALVAGALMSFYQATLPPFPLLLGSRVIEGASHLAIVVAAPTFIAQLSAPGDRAFLLTLWGTFFGVAYAILAWAGLPLVESGGIPALFLAHGVYLAAFAALLWAMLPRIGGGAAGRIGGLAELIRGHVAIYRSPFTAAPGIGWLFYTFSFLSFLTVIPPFLPEDSRAWVLGALPLVGIATSMTVGVALTRAFGAMNTIYLGFGLSAALAALMTLAPGAPVLALAFSATLGLIQGATFAAVPELNETAARQAQGNGALAQMGNLGNSIGTPVVVALIAAFGAPGLSLSLAGVLALGLLAHLLLARARQQGAQSS